MIFAIPFPSIDPVIFEVGVFAVRWYSLAYLAGLILGWMYMKRLCRRTPPVCTVTDVDDFLVWATLGVVLGGRLGIVLFYQFDYFMANPAKIIAVWEGGMSFHGGFLGVVGLFFGRIANFINSELWGRAADVPWAVVFPTGGPEPRHPSQIYEALLEGALLFAILFIFSRFDAVRRRPGLLMGIFIAGYALARMTAEFFREPDSYIGFLAFGTTWGQWLSLPMFAAGVFFIWRAWRKPLV